MPCSRLQMHSKKGMDMTSVFENKFVQWAIVIIAVSFVKAMASVVLDVPSYPARGLFALIDHREWASIAYFFIHDIGEIIKGAYLLRALGFIKFI